MDGLHEMAGSGVPVEIGGCTYQLRPLRAKDWGEAARCMIQRRTPPLEIVKQRLSGLPIDLQKHLVELAYQDERQGELLSLQDVHHWFSTAEGKIFHFWLTIRQAHPEISLDRAEQLVNLADEQARKRIADPSNDGLPMGNCSGPTTSRAENKASESRSPGGEFSAT